MCGGSKSLPSRIFLFLVVSWYQIKYLLLHNMRQLHEGDLLRLGFRKDAKAHKVALGIRASVTYVSTLPSPSSSAPCISSFVQSLSTFANVPRMSLRETFSK